MLNTLFNSIDISSSGISAQRTRMNIVSENIANAETTRTADGGPYRRKIAVVKSGVPGQKFSDILKETWLSMDRTKGKHYPEKKFREVDRCNLAGTHVAKVVKDNSPFKMVFDPNHPDADEKGYVAKPNVNVVQEMTDLISVTRSFEANVTALNSSKEMLRKIIKL